MLESTGALSTMVLTNYSDKIIVTLLTLDILLPVLNGLRVVLNNFNNSKCSTIKFYGGKNYKSDLKTFTFFYIYIFHTI